MLHSGIDLHKNDLVVTTLDADGGLGGLLGVSYRGERSRWAISGSEPGTGPAMVCGRHS